jgi:putative Holliday junction resolvase
MVHRLPTEGRILGLDIGDKRIGLAVTHVIAKLPAPIETLPNDENLITSLHEIIKREDIRMLVVGIPRNLKGEETAQSDKIRTQAQRLAKELEQTVIYVDESLSSARADNYISESSKELAQDSVAACFILEEFLGTIESV